MYHGERLFLPAPDFRFYMNIWYDKLFVCKRIIHKNTKPTLGEHNCIDFRSSKLYTTKHKSINWTKNIAAMFLYNAINQLESPVVWHHNLAELLPLPVTSDPSGGSQSLVQGVFRGFLPVFPQHLLQLRKLHVRIFLFNDWHVGFLKLFVGGFQSLFWVKVNLLRFIAVITE